MLCRWKTRIERRKMLKTMPNSVVTQSDKALPSDDTGWFHYFPEPGRRELFHPFSPLALDVALHIEFGSGAIADDDVKKSKCRPYFP